jgi:hypothetical protein
MRPSRHWPELHICDWPGYRFAGKPAPTGSCRSWLASECHFTRNGNCPVHAKAIKKPDIIIGPGWPGRPVNQWLILRPVFTGALTFFSLPASVAG